MCEGMREGEVLQTETKWKYENTTGADRAQRIIRTHEEYRIAGETQSSTKERLIEFVLLFDYLV
jgi:hypothetical protein